MSNWKWKDVPTRRIEVGGVSFAYRELGPCSGVPVIFLHHLMAVLDDWDPRVIDGIAAQRRCLGRFGAKNRRMRQDAITFIRAFARRDHDLVLIARGKSRLDDLAARLHAECNVAVDVLPADLTNRTDLSALETRLREDPRIGILINNAGMPQASGFVEQTNENIERLITLNTTALTRLAAAIAPRFGNVLTWTAWRR